jgi:hypothetical protein
MYHKCCAEQRRRAIADPDWHEGGDEQDGGFPAAPGLDAGCGGSPVA